MIKYRCLTPSPAVNVNSPFSFLNYISIYLFKEKELLLSCRLQVRMITEAFSLKKLNSVHLGVVETEQNQFRKVGGDPERVFPFYNFI